MAPILPSRFSGSLRHSRNGRGSAPRAPIVGLNAITVTLSAQPVVVTGLTFSEPEWGQYPRVSAAKLRPRIDRE
jgi:hypothetical protein